MTRLTINPAFRAHFHPPRTVVLLSDVETRVFTDPLVFRLLTAVERNASEGEALAEVAEVAGAAECLYVLRKLTAEGFVEVKSEAERSDVGRWWRLVDRRNQQLPPRKAAVAIICLDGPVPAFLVQCLVELGIDVQSEADLLVVLTDSLLDSRLRDINDARMRSKKPWMIAKIWGAAIRLGPLIDPARTACWACLAHRLRAHAVHGVDGDVLKAPVVTLRPAEAIAASHLSLLLGQYFFTDRAPVMRGAILAIDLPNMAMTIEPVARWPRCPGCGGGVDALATGDDEALLIARTSGAAGAIRRLTRVALSGAPDVFLYAAEVNALQRETVKSLGDRRFALGAGGKGMTAEAARESAIFEALERFSCVYEPGGRLVKASSRSLGEIAVAPDALNLVSDGQYACRDAWNARYGRFQPIPQRHDPDQALHWVEAGCLTTGARKLVPVAHCYFFAGLEEQPSCIADSNGVAGGSDYEHATINAMLELIERDAVGIWWHNRLASPRIDLGAVLGASLSVLRRRYDLLGLELRAFDVRSDLRIPVYVAMSCVKERFPERLAFGFGCDTDERVALEKALLELSQKLPIVLGEIEASGDGLALLWQDVRRYGAAALEFLNFKSQDDPPEHLPALERTVAAVAGVLRSAGHDVFVVDMTKRDVGLPVVRAIAPGLRHYWRRNAPGRLYNSPVRAKRRQQPLSEDALNPIPLVL